MWDWLKKKHKKVTSNKLSGSLSGELECKR